MTVRPFSDAGQLGATAAQHAAAAIRAALAARRTARVLIGRGQTLIPALRALVAAPEIAWSEVELFHADEYLGVPLSHAQSGRRFLLEQVVAPTRAGRYHLLEGEHDAERTCRLEGAALAAAPIDVALLSLGANGRLAANDPPADFQSETPFLIVRLDEGWRQRAVAAGAFAPLAAAPERAITMSLRQILKARAILVLACGAEKAGIVQRCCAGPVSPFAPASILRAHEGATCYLDAAAAAGLRGAGA
jgi:glucosamine-6-phosphate deaminase